MSVTYLEYVPLKSSLKVCLQIIYSRFWNSDFKLFQMDLDFPYKVDYANRIQISNCELCKMQIDDGVLRFTKFVQVCHRDEKIFILFFNF